MIKFMLNNKEKIYEGDEKISILKYLRNIEGITSVKDGCSGQGACGACLVELNGKPTLSCVTPMSKVNQSKVITIEGFPKGLKELLGKAFVEKGAVQCGFCTPGFLMRTKVLLEENINPTDEEIIKALHMNLCRCTGYIKIFEAIKLAARALRDQKKIQLTKSAKVGARHPKYDAYEKALGQSPFVDDIKIEHMLHTALKFSDFPRAKVISIDSTEAEKVKGVKRVVLGGEIPGERMNGLIVKDWPVMVIPGEITRYIGDVLAGVVADTEEIARKAVDKIKVLYEVLEPLTNMLESEHSSIKIHETGNLLDTCTIKRGIEADQALEQADYVARGTFETQRIEHAFMETEAAIGLPWKGDGIELYSQSQGIYVDQKQLARILGIAEEKVKVNLVFNGGGFGGKEDLSVQGHAAVFSYLLKRPVKVHLTREESIRMHPKRHPIIMDYELGCDRNGKLTVLKARIIGDTGAYASVGMKVMERAAGHATGAYHIPNVDIVSKTVYTNNVPCGAMRGFGVNQVTFAVESCIDELCEKGGFDRWQFRYDNALVEGSMTATGQVLDRGVGVRETLDALKDDFYRNQNTGIACGIKNCGVGNGMADFSEVKIEIKSKDHIILHHGWTEMGQGVNTVALQVLCEETGWEPGIIEVKVSTESGARAEMTTSSRGTSLVGNAIIDAAKKIKKDIKNKKLEELVGKIYTGKWICDWTTKPGASGEVITHYSYSYASQLVVLDDNGKVEKVFAAHDAGKIINPTLFEGQIEGAVVMGLGYALTEDLPMQEGKLLKTKLRSLGVPRAKDVPAIEVRGVEKEDPLGPYGAKGIGEIGMVPTAAAVANALYQYDKQRRYKLPLKK